jgi:hypothetical protein
MKMALGGRRGKCRANRDNSGAPASVGAFSCPPDMWDPVPTSDFRGDYRDTTLTSDWF